MKRSTIQEIDTLVQEGMKKNQAIKQARQTMAW